jgi:putative membrane protein
MAMQDEGHEPDYRFTLANERTFLAWIRTALAVLAGAVLLHQFETRLQPEWLRTVLGALLALLAGLLSLGAQMRWKQVQRAMRMDQPLPSSRLMPVLSASLLAFCVVMAVLLIQP